MNSSSSSPQPRRLLPLPRLLIRLLLLGGRRKFLLLPPLAPPPHQRVLRGDGGQLPAGRGRERVPAGLQDQRLLQGEPGQVRAGAVGTTFCCGLIQVFSVPDAGVNLWTKHLQGREERRIRPRTLSLGRAGSRAVNSPAVSSAVLGGPL